MAWTYPLDYTMPDNGYDPRQCGDYFQADKQGWQERLNVDHFMPWTGTSLSDLDAGEHRKVLFHGPIAAPTTGVNKGALYTLDVDVDPEAPTVTKAMLNWKDENANAVQLTTIYDVGGGSEAACLNLTVEAAAAANGVVCDDDTIEGDPTNGFQLKAGGSGTGVLYTHCGTDAGDFIDDVTLEAGASGFQIKDLTAPSAGSDVYPEALYVPVASHGSFTGTGVSLDLDTGLTIRHMVIRRADGTGTTFELIKTTAGSRVWGQENSANYDADFTISGTVLTFKNTRANADGATYYWNAIGERA